MPTPENPIILEHPETPVFSENLKQAGISTTPTTIQSSVVNSSGVSTPKTSNGTIQPQADPLTLIHKAKGKVSDAATWLAKFLLRALARSKYASNTN